MNRTAWIQGTPYRYGKCPECQRDMQLLDKQNLQEELKKFNKWVLYGGDEVSVICVACHAGDMCSITFTTIMTTADVLQSEDRIHRAKKPRFQIHNGDTNDIFLCVTAWLSLLYWFL